jgi:hypothetical protein
VISVAIGRVAIATSIEGTRKLIGAVTFPSIVMAMIHTSGVTAIIIEPPQGRVFRCIEMDAGAKRRQSRSAPHR